MKQSLPLLPVLLLLALAAWGAAQTSLPPVSPPPAYAPVAPPPNVPTAPAPGQAPQYSPANPPADGNALIRAALVRLQGHASIAAKVRHRVNLFDSELVGSGDYYQQGAGTGMQIRLELRTQLAGQTSSLQQVADGRYLWTDKTSGGGRQVSKINLLRVRQAVQAQAVGAPYGAPTLLAIGGLTKLLESLAERFTFDAPGTVELGGLPALAIVGRWNPVESPAGKAGGPLAQETGHLPAEVLVVFAREDLFPHVVEYRRGQAPGNAAGGQPLVRMELYEVQIDQPIDNRHFVYASDAIEIADRTDWFLRENGLVPREEGLAGEPAP